MAAEGSARRGREESCQKEGGGTSRERTENPWVTPPAELFSTR